jgi:hypothetical protein
MGGADAPLRYQFIQLSTGGVSGGGPISTTFFGASDQNAMTKTRTAWRGIFSHLWYRADIGISGESHIALDDRGLSGDFVEPTGASGLATTFGMLFCPRIFVGIGEGGYGLRPDHSIGPILNRESRPGYGRILRRYQLAAPSAM